MSQASAEHHHSIENTGAGWRLWLRWVAVNAVGELGLGITLILGVSLAGWVAASAGAIEPIVTALLAILFGTLIEGMCVGTAQWVVLRRPMPSLRWLTWAAATGAGALAAWTMGMLPFTILSLSEGAAAETASGPDMAAMSEAVQLALAAGLGIVAGAVLAIAQWIVLRRFVRRAGW